MTGYTCYMKSLGFGRVTRRFGVMVVVVLAGMAAPSAGARDGRVEGTLRIAVKGFVGMNGGPRHGGFRGKKGPVRLRITSVSTNTVSVRVIKELPAEVVLPLLPGRYEVWSTCETRARTPVTVRAGRPTAITLECGLSIF